MSYDSLPEPSPRFVPGPTGIRMTCECCDFPTLSLAPNDFGAVDWESTVLACLLCSWESAPSLEDGTPDPEAPSAEERNEGYSLDAARSNFQQYCWMYDPTSPEPWMGGPPPAEELAVRCALRDAYSDLAGGDGWDRVKELEDQLRAAEEAHREQVEAELNDDPDAPDDPDALEG